MLCFDQKNTCDDFYCHILTKDMWSVHDIQPLNLTVVSAQYTAIGCVQDTITLSCPDPRTINIVSAIYGQYSDAICEECCPPNPMHDCKEQVSDNNFSEWLELKLRCDNTTSCSFQYNGVVINECETEYVADYMQIFYSCEPGRNSRI